MSLIPQAALPDSFPPYEILRQEFGFVPAIFRAQSLLPRVIEAEAQIAGAILLAPGALTRVQKETILLTLASRHRSAYCVSAHRRFLHELGVPAQQLDALARDYQDAGLSSTDAALLDFALKLGSEPASFHRGEIDTLRANGLTDEQILEAVLMTALTNFLCTLSAGLDVAPDFESPSIRFSTQRQSGSAASAATEFLEPEPRPVFSCEDVRAALGDCIDGEVSADIRRELETHLAECRTCQVLYDTTRKTLRIVTDVSSFEVPEAVSARLIARIMSGLTA